MVVELAVSAMEELAESAQAGESLWVPDPQTAGIESLRYEEYMQRFPPVIGPTPSGLEIEATRETGLVHMNASSLVETLMDEVRSLHSCSNLRPQHQLQSVAHQGLSVRFRSQSFEH